MSTEPTASTPRRPPGLAVRRAGPAAVISVTGDFTAQSSDALTAAYAEADTPGTRGLVLDFSSMEFMNSGGLGVLVTLLVRASRRQQSVAAFGLTEHYRRILAVTRLDEAIRLWDDEASATAAVLP